jgi:hypothetical protein
MFSAGRDPKTEPKEQTKTPMMNRIKTLPLTGWASGPGSNSRSTWPATAGRTGINNWTPACCRRRRLGGAETQARKAPPARRERQRPWRRQASLDIHGKPLNSWRDVACPVWDYRKTPVRPGGGHGLAKGTPARLAEKLLTAETQTIAEFPERKRNFAARSASRRCVFVPFAAPRRKQISHCSSRPADPEAARDAGTTETN